MVNACALKMYSYGEVTANKESGSWEIKAKLTEKRFTVEEESVTNPQKNVVEFDTGEGKAHIETVTDNSIKATWLPRNTNRITAPDVRRGDPVIIWKLGNKQYFWEELSEGYNKRLETVIWAFSSNPDAALDRLTLKNAYFISFSTHEKAIKLVTTKHNGEPYAYNVELNTQEGFHEVKDDVGNRGYLDSADTELGLVNANGSYVKVAKNDVAVNAVDNIIATAGKDVEFTCRKLIINAEEILGNAGKTTFSGDTTVEGKTTTNGLNNTGECTSSGGFDTDGSIRASGTITAEGGFKGEHV